MQCDYCTILTTHETEIAKMWVLPTLGVAKVQQFGLETSFVVNT